ncbi:MAG: hypothetical protein PSU94_01820 [Lacunisphaera sp.]|nr:hypothetical protein [Lacunisphaera sp.]
MTNDMTFLSRPKNCPEKLSGDQAGARGPSGIRQGLRKPQLALIGFLMPKRMSGQLPAFLLSILLVGSSAIAARGQTKYPDGRPAATLRMEAQDQGVILKHGDGPDGCDTLGARNAICFRENGTYYLFYDGTGEKGWLNLLATSRDLTHWEKKGPTMDRGLPGERDSAGANSPWVYREGDDWHMFYVGSPNLTDGVPSFPYLTLKAKGRSLAGPWIKQKEVVPFDIKPGTYYSVVASAGYVVRAKAEYMMFFSSTVIKPGNPSVILRTLGIARTKDLDGKWTVDPAPIFPVEEQVENSSLYFEPTSNLWFLFTNHIGLEKGTDEYTDAIWVYWSTDLNKWNRENKAVVLDGKNCSWSKKCIGLPSVVPIGNRLAVFYDSPGGVGTSHLGRDLGLAWLELPLVVPRK